MSFQEAVHLLLNPFAGRANRQQFFLFSLIFFAFIACGVLLSTWLKDGDFSLAYKFGFIAAGVYFLFVDIIRRFKDSDLQIVVRSSLETTKISGIVLFYSFTFLACIILLLTLVGQPILLASLGLIFWCSASEYKCLSPAFDLGASALFIEYYLLAFVVIGIPLLMPHERTSNKYGPPPVGFNLRTMLAATYPAHLLDAHKAERGAAELPQRSRCAETDRGEEVTALQVLNLFLNPFAGRANRQQFLFFVLIFLSVLLWLEIAMNAFDYDRTYDSQRLIIGLGGFYFVLVGSLRRLRDNDVNLLKTLRAWGRKAFMSAVILISILGLLAIFFKSTHYFLFFKLFMFPYALFLRLRCTITSSHCSPGMKMDLSSLPYSLGFLIGIIFVVLPLLLPNSRSANKYGPPPVGFNLRTMLKATYPAHLLRDQKAAGGSG